MSGVIHVITQLERGGAQRNTLETVAQLHHEGRPQLLLTGEPGALDEEAQQRLGPRFARVPHLVRAAHPLDDALALGALSSRIDAEVRRLRAPVVVHTHSTKAGVLGRLAAAANPGVAVVHTVHGFGFEAFGKRRAWLVEAAERVAARATGVFVFVSEGDRERAEEMGLLRDVPARVIRSGVDPAHFAPVTESDDARARFGIASDAHVATCVANLKPQKDPLFHVDVLAAWRALDPRAHLLFVGDGPLLQAAQERAREKGVAGAVTFAGFLDDPRPAYNAADVYLLASAWEGLPRSVLEATAAGLPCVVRDTGWAADLAWAKRLTALPASAPAAAFGAALHEAVRKAAATSARSGRPTRIPREFTLAGMLDDLRHLYDELVGPPLPSREERMPHRRRAR